MQEKQSFSSSLRHRFRLLREDMLENWFFVSCNRTERQNKESSVRPLPPEFREFILAKRIDQDKKRKQFEELAMSVTGNGAHNGIDKKENGKPASHATEGAMMM
jgi:hypothetical protein